VSDLLFKLKKNNFAAILWIYPSCFDKRRIHFPNHFERYFNVKFEANVCLILIAFIFIFIL